MDTLYLKKFNAKSSLEALEDEKGSLFSQINDAQQDCNIAFAEISYSECRRFNAIIASLKAKLSYIERMIAVAKKQAERPVFISHPDNWYADEL